MSDLTSHSLRLTPAQLFTPCNPDHLPFVTSDELEDLGAEFAHDRAVEALRFGLEYRRSGYNVFVLGEPGSGRHALVRRLIGEADGVEPLSDWCYVNNFADATRPRLMQEARARPLRQLQSTLARRSSVISSRFSKEIAQTK